jgi:hypothetical protein
VSTVSLHPSNGRNPKAQRHAIPKKLRMTNLTFVTRRFGNARLSQVDAWGVPAAFAVIARANERPGRSRCASGRARERFATLCEQQIRPQESG